MTTSDYLKIQTQILIAYDCLKGERLEDFLAESARYASTGDPVIDHFGQIAKADPARFQRLAEAALIFRAAAETPRKPISFEQHETREKKTA